MNRGEQIRRLRRVKDLTQMELAMLVGVSVTAVCEWERGAYSPCPGNAERLSYVLESDDREHGSLCERCSGNGHSSYLGKCS